MAVTSPPALAVGSGELFDRWYRAGDVRARDALIERRGPGGSGEVGAWRCRARRQAQATADVFAPQPCEDCFGSASAANIPTTSGATSNRPSRHDPEQQQSHRALHARRAGTVKAVYVSVGQRVDQGTPLLVLL